MKIILYKQPTVTAAAATYFFAPFAECAISGQFIMA